MRAALKHEDRRNDRQDEAKDAFHELRVCEHAQNEYSFVSSLLCVLCDSHNKKFQELGKVILEFRRCCMTFQLVAFFIIHIFSHIYDKKFKKVD